MPSDSPGRDLWLRIRRLGSKSLHRFVLTLSKHTSMPSDNPPRDLWLRIRRLGSKSPPPVRAEPVEACIYGVC